MTTDRAQIIQSYEDRLAAANKIIAEQTRQLAALYQALDPAKQGEFMIGGLLRSVREAKR